MRRLRSEGETLVAQTDREKQVLTQTLGAAQLEAQQNLRKAVADHQEEVQRLLAEKVRSFRGSESTLHMPASTFNPWPCAPWWQEAVRRSLQAEHEASLGRLRQEAEEQLERAEKEREELQEELRSIQQERDQSLLQAETEKQQV